MLGMIFSDRIIFGAQMFQAMFTLSDQKWTAVHDNIITIIDHVTATMSRNYCRAQFEGNTANK
jgi:hypothetical protein